VELSGVLALTAFGMISSLTLLVFLVIGGRKTRLDVRIKDLASRGTPAGPDADPVASFARSALPKMGAPLMPKSEEERTKLQTRLMHAGLYRRQAMVVFLGVKMLLMVGPVVLGLALGLTGLLPLLWAVIGGALLGIGGMIGPSFWLDKRKADRQALLRRSLPDVLDVLVICLDGGLSLPGAIRRVTAELKTAHRALAAELAIVQREMQLGRPAGEALRGLADRTDLEEVRSLASVLLQSERFGASLVKALRVHAENLREKRLQRAEELAAQAATKLLFPTVLLILPCVFVVVLAPAVIQLMGVFSTAHIGR
jgi:tight adherence protein C